ncbi:MAG: NADP-dependent oxidoreductase, partial [Mycobacterium sp.]|nr:NADP-dependent oxidoreductase [Mycobacterium sp.]
VGTSPPLALGVEAAGVIKAVGAHPSGFSVDDEVLCHPVPLRDQGTWAPFLIAPVGSLAHKPPEISWETAAIFPVPALTAEQVVGEALGLQRGETLLVNGAGGITGGLIVQLAALRGVDVLATASPRSADRVRGYGAREVIDYRNPMWPKHARELAKGSIDAVANAAPAGAAAAMTALDDGGRLATITSDPPASTRGISVTAVYVRSDGAQLDRLTALLASRRLSMPIPRSCSLGQAAAALAHVVAGREPSGVVITKDVVHSQPKNLTHQGVAI